MSNSLPPRQPGRAEFIALMAMMMATNAFSIDAMLPAMGEIGQELSPGDPVRVQMIVTFYIIGMGIGTFFTGPISDAVGRRPVIFVTGLIYGLGAILAWLAPTLETLLAARIVMGLGASGARVVSMAMIRDRFSGRAMAQITSLIITVFMLFPAIAPTLGAGIIWMSSWRGIFFACLVFSALAVLWFSARQPETLPAERRRPLRLPLMWAGLKEIAANPLVRRVMLAQVFCFAMMMTMISTTEMVFDKTLGLGAQFHLWFGAMAISSLIAPVMNSRIVVRFGMHRIVLATISVQVLLSGAYLAALLSGLVAVDTLVYYFLWSVTIFMTVGLCLGNLNAMAMEPMGHMAGIASSLITALSTIGGALLAIPAAARFDGTQIPLVTAVFVFMVCARVLLTGRLFTAPHAEVVAE